MIGGVRILIFKLYYPAFDSYQELCPTENQTGMLLTKFFRWKNLLSALQHSKKVYAQIISPACERNSVPATWTVYEYHSVDTVQSRLSQNIFK